MTTNHIVEQGEYLASIAKKYRITDYRTIYNHPQNAEFKRKYPNPNVIYPGESLFIPDMELKQESAATEQRHRYVLKTPKLLLRIALRDFKAEPIANAAYILKVEGPTIAEQIFKGSTNRKGLLQQEIPIGVESGEITLEKFGMVWPLQIGHLDPVDEVVRDNVIISGVQARLNNLGYKCGQVDGVLGPQTMDAIKAFQRVVLKRQNPGGEPDKATRDALVKEHGC